MPWLRTFLNFLEKAEILKSEHNPVQFIYKLEIIPEDPDLPPVAFPPEDTATIFHYLHQLAQSDNKQAIRHEAIRNLALLRFAYVTALREVAIAKLLLCNLDLSQHHWSATILATEKQKNAKCLFRQASSVRHASLAGHPTPAG